MKENLQILHLEDVDLDAEIIENILQGEGIKCTITRASNKKEYLSKIHQNHYDVILADNLLPDYNGMDALKYAKEHKPQIPLIYVSGTIGEEKAVEALRYGAKDYVFKHNLNKLVPAIQRVIDEVEIRKAAKENEAKYRSFFENSMDAILLTSPDGKIFSANPAACIMFGYSEEELIKLGRSGIVDMTDPQLPILLSKRALTGKAQGELKFIRKDGTSLPAEIASAIFKDSNGQERTSMIIRDITERKQNEESLKKQKDEFETIFNLVPAQIWYKDTLNNFIRVNRQVCNAIGVTKDKIEGHNAEELFPLFAQKYYNDDLEVINRGKPKLGIIEQINTAEGELRWIHTDKIPVLGNDSEINGLIVFVQDITERIFAEQELVNINKELAFQNEEIEKRAEELNENKTLLTSILDSSLSGIMAFNSIRDAEGAIVDFAWQLVNRTAELVVGRSNAELVGKRLLEEMPGNRAEGIFDLYVQVVETGIPLNHEHFYEHEQVKSWFHTVAIKQLDGFVVTFSNITERKRGEASLRESEERFRHSFDYAATGICINGIDQKFQRVNQAFSEMIGYEEDELKNLTFSDITHPDDLSVGVSQKEELMAGEINNMSFEKRYIRKDKRIIWAYVSASLVRDVNHKPQFFITQMIDITERIQSEEELRKLSRAVEQSPVSITITDHDGKVEYVNPKFTEVTGYSLDEVKGKTLRILKSGYHQREFYEKLWDTILSGKDWQGEFYNKKKNGELFWEDVIISPIVNENGNITHFIGIEEDITEKKKMMEELIHAKDIAEKSNSLKDAFIANISHEIRTPLNGIRGMTSLIKETFSPNMTDEEAGFFTAIDGSCDRIIRTTDLILNYSQLETGTFTFIPKQLELSTICMNLVNKYNVSAKSKSLTLLFENKVGGTVISGDEYSITQVISNLIENAIIYTKSGFVRVKLYENPQNEILLDVIDSGIGIGVEHLDHLFESFRQEQMGYSRSYEGLGLGLALVKKILELHKATISVESKKGEGTVFTINFGKSLQNVEMLPAKQNIITKVEVTSTKSDRLVLIVEDDEINQTIIKRYVNKKYNALVTDSYDNMMENLENNKVDLILMDISLQGSKNGLEITKELKASEEYKHIPIIASTAHAFERDRNATLKAGCDDYLAKPFSRDQLLEKLEKFLNAGNN